MAEKIRVLHILYKLRSSGAEVMLKKAVSYWRESGVVLHVLSTAKVIGPYVNQLSNEGIVIHHLPFENSLSFYFQLIKLIRSNHIDVVQIHTERTMLTYAILARLAGASRIIRTLHSTYTFEGLTRFNRALRRWIIRHLGVVQVSISDLVRQNEQTRFRNPTHLIYNWYDDAHFYPPSLEQRSEVRKTLGLIENEKVIVSVGNCAQVKNHAAIIQALAIMNKNGQKPLYWHVGEEEVEGREKKLVCELQLNSQVHFWGRQEDVRPFLWAADAFIMPSFHEGFSIAMIEALACGIPVILARSPGLDGWSTVFPEIIYTDTTPAGLAYVVGQVLEEQKNYDSTSHALAKAKFTAQRGAEEYLRLYKKL
jgi:glycosyltransferase involved in cell wall biosynthesis